MELIITITEREAQLILNGLGELQAKVSIELILKLKNQCEAEIKRLNKEEKQF